MDEVYSSDDELDRLSERFENYSLSADVSESESSTGSLSRRQFASASNLAASSSAPLQGPLFGESSVLSKRMNVNLPSLFGPRNNVVVPRTEKKPGSELSEVELMKERFSKLLLGEDMSGGGKGVCTALAISNAITNLSASVFGELWKLEQLAAQKKDLWRREMEWLLCVSDSIVELTPSFQGGGAGGTFEVMVPRPRSDLYVNLPALKKLDAMLISIMDGFQDSEFHYVNRGVVVSAEDDNDGGRPCLARQEEKWWLPFPKVPRKGLSEETRKRLQQCRECTNQILKAAMAINGNVLAEMEVPNVYLRSLPKSGKACLGETIHRYMTADNFSPECLLDYLDLSSEYTTLEIANRIEAAVHVWKQKYTKRRLMMSKSGKSTWGGKVKGISVEKSKLLAYRAESLLQNLKLRFPGLPQTALDMSKIQFNKDVGHSILESYSRVMESLAFNIMARIDDLLYIDEDTKRQAVSGSMCLYDTARFGNSLPRQNKTTQHNNISIEHQYSCASSAQPRSLHRHRTRGSTRSVKMRGSTSDTDNDDI